MKNFDDYVGHLESLSNRLSDASRKEIDAALDGQAFRELERLVGRERIRASGAYFTGSVLARKATRGFRRTLDVNSVIVDPACGAGDLLLACADAVPVRSTIEDTLQQWAHQFQGQDVHLEFIQAAELRLRLAAARRFRHASPVPLTRFPHLKVGCSISDSTIYERATHLVANPPFVTMETPLDCRDWSSGGVNAAAVFTVRALHNCLESTHFLAILPDVLRSGSRYGKWRAEVEKHATLRSIRQIQLDKRWADVDVFVLDAVIRKKTRRRSWNWQISEKADQTIASFFDVMVGPVVPFRDPSVGPWHAYVTTEDLPAWGSVCCPGGRRRFNKRVFEPPFVTIRRNSRSDDVHRAVPTLVTGDRPVAVENHLLVCTPKRGSLSDCKRLIQLLKCAGTSDWLNQRLRCRHLTVEAVRDIPWNAGVK